jgi:hypothetical protein
MTADRPALTASAKGYLKRVSSTREGKGQIEMSFSLQKNKMKELWRNSPKGIAHELSDHQCY